MKLKVYQISAHLVQRELRNATFEEEKMPTSIKRPDSVHKINSHLWRLYQPKLKTTEIILSNLDICGELQGDISGCSQGSVDIKTNVPF